MEEHLNYPLELVKEVLKPIADISISKDLSCGNSQGLSLKTPLREAMATLKKMLWRAA